MNTTTFFSEPGPHYRDPLNPDNAPAATESKGESTDEPSDESDA